MLRLLQLGKLPGVDRHIHALRYFPTEGERRFSFCRREFNVLGQRVTRPEPDGREFTLSLVTCTACLSRATEDLNSLGAHEAPHNTETEMATTKKAATKNAPKKGAKQAAEAPAAAEPKATAGQYRLSQFKMDRAVLRKKLGHLSAKDQKALGALLDREPPVYGLDEVVSLSGLVFTSKDQKLVDKKDKLPNKEKVLAWHAENNQRKQAEVLQLVEDVMAGKVKLTPVGANGADRAAAAKTAREAKKAAPAPAPAKKAGKASTATTKEDVDAGEALEQIRDSRVEPDGLFEIPEEEVDDHQADEYKGQTVELQTLPVGRKFWIPGTALSGKLRGKSPSSAEVTLTRTNRRGSEDTYISLGTMVVPGDRPAGA